MKISKSEIKYLGLLILAFAIINILANLLGLWIPKLLKAQDLAHLDSVFKEFVRPISIQILLFGILTLIAFIFMKNKKLALYAFATFQFLIFHVLFFLNIKIYHGIHFITSIKGFGIKYLSYCGQYLTDLLYLRFPINGNFDDAVFMPYNAGTFYLHWILLNIIYYFVITWLSIKLVDVFIPQYGKFQQPDIID
jgi:hypothetical protein